MSRFRNLVFAAVATTIAAQGSAVNADILYDNLSVSSGGTASVSSLDHGPLADSFSTGVSPTSLTDVKLLLGASAPVDGGSFSVTLLSDSSTSPGSLLTTIGTVNDSSLSTSLGTVDLSLATPYALTANTRYWIEVSGTSTSGVWSFTAVNSGTGVAGEYNFYAGLVKANSDFTPYQMQVNTSTVAVPEPGTLTVALGTIAIAALAIARRRLVRP